MKKDMMENVSLTVKSRLPRYYRYLTKLISEDKLRISSNKLAKMMGVTASQIRQDLGSIGVNGQKGYGYNVITLRDKLAEIMGLRESHKAVVIGSGDLGKALVNLTKMGSSGNSLIALFDVVTTADQQVAGVPVLPISEFVDFCNRERVTLAALTAPEFAVNDLCGMIAQTGIKGVLSFTTTELELPDSIAVEEVHIGDFFMMLCHDIKEMSEETVAGGGK